MSRITECAVCGLAPGDLPDGVDPELVFERGEDGEWRDQACASRSSWSLDFTPARTPGDAESTQKARNPGDSPSGELLGSLPPAIADGNTESTPGDAEEATDDRG